MKKDPLGPRHILWYMFYDTRALFVLLMFVGWCAIEMLNYIKYGKL